MACFRKEAAAGAAVFDRATEMIAQTEMIFTLEEEAGGGTGGGEEWDKAVGGVVWTHSQEMRGSETADSAELGCRNEVKPLPFLLIK